VSASIPRAFGSRSLYFAGAYVALQLLRSGFMVAAFAGQRMGRNYAQLLAWSAIAGAFWIAGALGGGDARLGLWTAAVLVDYGAPLHGFALPRLGRTPMRDWTLAGGHLAERNRLVLLIAFGESILAIGATFAGLHWSASAVVALVVGFAVTVSLWWILAQPAAPVGAASAAVTLGSPALYLVGEALFKHAVTGRAPWPGLAGGAALALLVPVALVATRLELSAAVALVALALAANIWTRPNRPRLL
jgi:low temperature requirement protein LtrA